MEIQEGLCCATREIDGLDMCNTPKEAMDDFLDEQCLTSGDYSHNSYGDAIRPSNENVSAFYYFTGIMGYTDNKANKPKYGQKFSAFIKKEKLGKVIFSGAAPNRVNHPTHIVGVWVWRPSIKGLKSYVTRNKLNAKYQ